ncbi:MAG: chromate efflux transporter [Thaumarchaeota archaeon]|nr:chromate efflux transporter [Nitrososphaerota archaeon]
MHQSNGTSLTSLFFYFFRLAWVGFGGPLVHISMMQRDLVEKRRWLAREEFMDMLGLTNLLPGPNSTEMCIHIGYRMRGRIGAVVSGLAFTLPGFFMMLALSWLYFQFIRLPSVSGVFYGINPAVVVIIAITAFRLGRSSVNDWKGLGILISAFLAILLTNINEAIILLSAGIAGLMINASWRSERDSARLLPLLAPIPIFAFMSLASLPRELLLFLEFLKAGSLLFGTGLVIIPLIGPDVVEGFGWLSYEQFIDGVTLGQITPGPVVKTAAFVGYKVAGVLGATVATLGVFLPAFVIVILLASLLRKVRTSKLLQDFLNSCDLARQSLSHRYVDYGHISYKSPYVC